MTPLAEPIKGFEWLANEWDEQNEFSKEAIVISLGYNCAPARHFQEHHLAEAYLPFDWCFSEFESIYLAFYNDFSGFLSSITILSSGEHYHEVRDETYNIRFIHDFKTYGDTRSRTIYDYDEIKAKYERRINRLRRALSSKKHVYLFRTNITKQDALLLRNLISERYPSLTYTLVVMNNTPDFKKDWSENNIRNFFLSTPSSASVTEEMKHEWNPIFNALGLIR